MPENHGQGRGILVLLVQQYHGDGNMKIRIPTVVIAAILVMAIPQNAKCG